MDTEICLKRPELKSPFKDYITRVNLENYSTSYTRQNLNQNTYIPKHRYKSLFLGNKNPKNRTNIHRTKKFWTISQVPKTDIVNNLNLNKYYKTLHKYWVNTK